MTLVEELIDTKSKIERQSHLDLSEPCLERGGNSTNHKGVLAQYLDTNIPYGIQYPLCHACHNGKCSNPKHLYWGTCSENNQDAFDCGAKKPSNLGKPAWNRGKPCKEETKRKISDKMKIVRAKQLGRMA